jgi:hypothetical protein
MQWLGIIILIGLLALLFVAILYFGFNQKTPNRRPRAGDYGKSDFYHSEGEGNPRYNLEKLDARSPRARR